MPDPFSIAGGILAFAKDAMSIVSGVRTARREDRDRASDYFAHLGDTLAAIEAEIRVDRVPYNKCGELLMLADRLPKVTQGIVPPAEADALAALLRQNHDVEGMAIALMGGTAADREPLLAQIGEASGKFTAMAHIIRAGG